MVMNETQTKRDKTMKTTKTYEVTAPKTAGSIATVIGTATKIADARKIAAQFDGRRDLTRQDVRIERAGELVEYAGPAR